jgi:hypothetical protein
MGMAQLSQGARPSVQAVNDHQRREGNARRPPSSSDAPRRACPHRRLEARYQLIKAGGRRGYLSRIARCTQEYPLKQLAELGCVEKSRDGEFQGQRRRAFTASRLLENLLPGVKACEGLLVRGVAAGVQLCPGPWIRCGGAAGCPGYPQRPLISVNCGISENIRGLCMKDPAEFVPELKQIRPLRRRS